MFGKHRSEGILKCRTHLMALKDEMQPIYR
jgi:hypothetical protein